MADTRAVVAQASSAPDAPLRAVVNLVGGFGIGGRVHETMIEEFESLVQLNLRPLYLTTQAARLRAGTAQPRGRPPA